MHSVAMPRKLKHLSLGSGRQALPLQEERRFSLWSLVLAAVVHLLLFYCLLPRSTEVLASHITQAPMMVSLLPSSQPDVVQELPLAPKPVLPIRKPQPEVAKQVSQPVSAPVAITEPVVQEQPPVKETGRNSNEVVKQTLPVHEPMPEPKIEPPRFGVAYLNNPEPVYPPISRRLGEQGRVMLKVLVNSKGQAESVELEDSSGSDRLDRAALEAVRNWSFVPAKRDDQPMSAYVLVPLNFSLKHSLN
ncbi:MAG TPA: energy transducer TonB [Methylophilaceae bacterium]|jgi:protein TonB